MKRILRPTPLAVLFLSALLMAGCKSDLELNAPYKNITVVYALLSKNDANDRHYLKINKAYLGEGNAFIQASVPDSTLYTDGEMQAKVERLNEDGQVLNTYTVQSEMLDGRDPGLFPYPQHKMYYFDAELDSNSTYRVTVLAKGETVTATAAIARVPGLASNMVSPGSYRLRVYNGNAYVNYVVPFVSSQNGKRYEVSYRFRWREMFAEGDTSSEKSFTQVVGTAVANNLNGNQSLSVTIPGESFFQTVAERVPMTPGVTKRIVTGFDLIWAVGGSDLHTYMQLSNPISGVVEERPDYSNVNGGYGLVSSRRFRYIYDKGIEGPTQAYLKNGPLTSHLAFCWPSGDHACPP